MPVIFHSVPYIFFSRLSQNLQKWLKCATFLICGSHFLQFKKFHIENNTGLLNNNNY